MVGDRLAPLGRRDPRWRVLLSIPIGSGDSDSDHLAIGPGFIYTLNSKHHPDAVVWVSGDTVLINGQRHPYMPKSRHEAAMASRRLSAACDLPVHVVGVIVPINARSLTIKREPVGVHIVPRMALVNWLRDRPETLFDSVIETVFDAARRSTTWVLIQHSRAVTALPGHDGPPLQVGAQGLARVGHWGQFGDGGRFPRGTKGVNRTS